MRKNELSKIWQIMGNIEACKEQLNLAIKDKDWHLVETVSNYLNKVKERLDSIENTND